MDLPHTELWPCRFAPDRSEILIWLPYVISCAQSKGPVSHVSAWFSGWSPSSSHSDLSPEWRARKGLRMTIGLQDLIKTVIHIRAINPDAQGPFFLLISFKIHICLCRRMHIERYVCIRNCSWRGHNGILLYIAKLSGAPGVTVTSCRSQEPLQCAVSSSAVWLYQQGTDIISFPSVYCLTAGERDRKRAIHYLCKRLWSGKWFFHSCEVPGSYRKDNRNLQINHMKAW